MFILLFYFSVYILFYSLFIILYIQNAIYALFSVSHSSTFSLTAATNPLALG